MRNHGSRGISLGEFLSTSASLARIAGCGDVRGQRLAGQWRLVRAKRTVGPLGALGGAVLGAVNVITPGEAKIAASCVNEW
jgi:hypothetical protein